jgi:hypothetical protein
MSESSGSKVVTVTTAAGATDVIEANSKLYGVVLTTDLTNDATCTIKNGAGGDTILVLRCPGTDDCRNFQFEVPVKFSGTINVTTAGTGATSYVFVGK